MKGFSYRIYIQKKNIIFQQFSTTFFMHNSKLVQTTILNRKANLTRTDLVFLFDKFVNHELEADNNVHINHKPNYIVNYYNGKNNHLEEIVCEEYNNNELVEAFSSGVSGKINIIQYAANCLKSIIDSKGIFSMI